jgi:YHS domain-containing protein
MVEDPACRMQVDEGKSGAISAHKGAMHHFCCPACKATLDTTPENTDDGSGISDDRRKRHSKAMVAWLKERRHILRR